MNYSFPKPSRSITFIEFILMMASVTALPAVSTDIVLPALGLISEELQGATSTNTSLVVSLFFAGLGLGQLVFGPLCDSLGRRKTVFLGMALFVLGTLICIFATTLNTLLLGRFIQAFGASGPRIGSMAIIRDRFEGNEMARTMSFIMMIFITVPMIAPALGQTLLLAFDWHVIFVFLLIEAVLTSMWLFFRQEETLVPEKRRPLNFRAIARDFASIIKMKSVLGFTLASGASYGLMVTYVSTAQHLFQNIYQTGSKFPIYFAVIALSIGIASYTNGKLVRKIGMMKMVFLAMWLNLGGATVLILLSIATHGVPHLNLFTAVMFFGFFGNGILMGNLTSLAMQPLAHSAGFGAAIISSLSTLISVPFAITVSFFLKDTVIPFAVGFLFASCSAILLAHWANNRQIEEQARKDN